MHVSSSAIARGLVNVSLFTFGVSGWTLYFLSREEYFQSNPIDPGSVSDKHEPQTRVSSEISHLFPVDSSVKSSAKGGMHLQYDFQTRNPKWVLERLTASNFKSNSLESKSRPQFSKDDVEIIPSEFQNSVIDFQDTGYDKGHLAAAANHKGDEDEFLETFKLSNVSPQVGVGFNRHYWNRLEQFTRRLAKLKDVEEAYVVTGPLFLPRCNKDGCFIHYEVLGVPPRIAVPTHFFKVLLLKFKNGNNSPIHAVAGWVLPNKVISSDTPLSSFEKSLEYIENISGLQFFPSIRPLSSPFVDSLCSKHSCSLKR